MMKKMIITLLLATSTIMAAPLNIAVVNMNQVLQASPQMVQVQASLDKTFSPKHAAIVKQVEAVKKDSRRLQRDGSVMKSDEREALAKKINDAKEAVMRAQAKFQQDYEKARASALQEIFGRINAITTKFAKEKHFDLILNRNTVPYADNSLDVTSELIKRIKG